MKKKPIEQPDSSLTIQETHLTKQDTFRLWYSYAGLGSGYGTMQPTFRVIGTDFIYTFEQNSSFTGQFDRKSEIVCKGKLRTSSIDSITTLLKDIKDTLVYKTNTGIMSGGIHTISIASDTIHVTFQLHNASDSTARKIVDMLNSHIPKDKKKLWLFDFPDEK
ncbi:MAG: hypothetical protein SGI87_10505 [Flavobacteriales bacterium]|nr:hypothetical protein [Flavobacteriales bacterium]